MKDKKAIRESFDALYNNALEALMDMRILDGIALLRSIQKDLSLAEEHKAECGRILDLLEGDYKAMLRFIASHGRDDDSRKIHLRINRQALEVLMHMHRHVRMNLADDIYGLVAKQWSSDHTVEALRDAMDHMHTVSKLDYANTMLTFFWTRDMFTKEEREELEHMLDQAPLDWQTLVLGGLYLALTEYFDPQKYILIYHFIASEHPTIRVDATIYLLIIQHMQADYIQFVPYLPKFGHDKRTLAHLKEAQRAMLVQAESPNCSSIVAEKVKKTVETQGGSYGIVNQIIELPIPTQIDFNYSSFVPVYTSERFRSNPVLWWVPFSVNSPLVGDSIKKFQKNVNPATHIQSIFCDVDKFAICECLEKGTLPGKQSSGPKTDPGSLFAQILFIEPTDLSDLCSLRMQNMYRFYTYSIWSRQMKNPFKDNLYVAGKEELAPYFSEDERRLLLHSLLIMHDYKLCIVVADDMIARHKCAPAVFRAKGISHQHFKEYEAALQAYRQAFLMDEKDVWTIAHMQNCYEQLGMKAEVVDCLLSRLVLQPKQENELTAKLARTYKELERYEDALSCYYKMYYKDAGNTEASGGVVWCLFMLKKYGKALQEVHTLAENTAGLTDYECMVAGHLEFVRGNLKAAIAHYESFFSLYRCRKGREDSSPWKLLERSEPVLARHGVTHEQFRLLMDLLENSDL